MVSVICGKGNNGGGRYVDCSSVGSTNPMMFAVFVLDLSDKKTDDFKTNLERVHQLKDLGKISLNYVQSVDENACVWRRRNFD